MRLAGLLESFSSNILVTAQGRRPHHHLLAQLQARSAFCFIALIKSLNFAELLEHLTVIS
jgi:hypothetical protein